MESLNLEELQFFVQLHGMADHKKKKQAHEIFIRVKHSHNNI